MGNVEGIKQNELKIDYKMITVREVDLSELKEKAREIMKPQARYHNDQVTYLKGIIAAQIDKASGMLDLLIEL